MISRRSFFRGAAAVVPAAVLGLVAVKLPQTKTLVDTETRQHQKALLFASRYNSRDMPYRTETFSAYRRRDDPEYVLVTLPEEKMDPAVWEWMHNGSYWGTFAQA